VEKRRRPKRKKGEGEQKRDLRKKVGDHTILNGPLAAPGREMIRFLGWESLKFTTPRGTSAC
jgi:hypothetical protein